jgi:hypothetical protein
MRDGNGMTSAHDHRKQLSNHAATVTGGDDDGGA